ncbi:ATP-binding protein [Corynebacterium cystitidis]|uniref:AAA+ ATPase domain-containing protein n=1 Tax=Corynebacterium cystitidis DSM 20524 TaxID=1121357 RepID=A0A1H9RXZ5_9CORY|nr:DUF4143 domain-containing protein [Corynebacterium cystitidis]WJY82136.1 hypothetical protein CCYS_06000 [Corynebacterium cystitidis DSM 20524]SER77686.1 hypothetical protein SAMN05661109_00975 [Corynebacterium cystitidis DSM 20524]SNV78799.1 AAA+ superfamily ATPase [Corynebacterium cystitidis]
MKYLPRTIDRELDELLPIAPAIAIDGPKGVGKTATAARRASTIWQLDDPQVQQLAQADFSLETVSQTPLLIDEWQKYPPVWDSVRRRADAGAPPGSYLLTGSATPSSEAGTHSGAGRILSLRMRPMAIYERGATSPTVSLSQLLSGKAEAIGGETSWSVKDYAAAIISSGFPGMTDLPPRLRTAQLDAYLSRIIDRDLPDAGRHVRLPEVLSRWMRAYAAATATTASYSTLLDTTTAGDGKQPNKATTAAYRDHLTAIWIVDPLKGWLPNHNEFKRAQQAPKHYLADPALSARLLRISETSLLTHTMFGPLFEALVVLSVRVAAQAAQAEVFHLRLNAGEREIDLIVEGDEGQIIAIEVKLAPVVTDHDVRHLNWLADQLPDQVVERIVVTTGQFAYRRPDGVAVVPLALLGA